MKQLTRRVTFLAIAIAVALLAVAPHQHDGLSEFLQREGTTERIGACDSPYAEHVHPARVRPHHPCPACLRDHSAGTLRLVAIPFARPVATGIAVATAASARAGAIVLTASRGPPV